jgi:sulfopyruvate decarboxylase TPP-binding subunit
MNSSLPPGEGISPAADQFVALLAKHGVTHVITVPDNTSAVILQSLEQAGGADHGGDDSPSRTGLSSQNPPLRLVYATREGEAVGLASGIWLGGGHPVVLIQNTGLLEAGDGLRGTAARMGAPILLFITCRGYAKARGAGLTPGEGPVTREVLVRSDLDSVAHMTESTLQAWGIPYSVLQDSSDLGVVEESFDRAGEEERPVAVLLDTSFD